MTSPECTYEQRKKAWIAEQLKSAPPLGPRQQALIRSIFSEMRTRKADAA